MPLLKTDNYLPPVLLRNGHANTIYSSLFRYIGQVYDQRQRIHTPDGDFLDLDFSTVGSDEIMILVHGLEGSSQTSYMKGMAQAINRSGWDAVSVNMRGCSGAPNRLYSSYHSGQTSDIHTVIQYLKQHRGYEKIGLIGFSLGGNIVLKLMGESEKIKRVEACAAISVPCDLKATANHLNRVTNYLYRTNLLGSLKQKLLLKKKQFPNIGITKQMIHQVQDFQDFDNLYTAPAHGFKNADDYWSLCSCKRFLNNIRTPSLLINAWDDPFFPKAAYPFEQARHNECFYLSIPNYGGHLGFVTDMSFKSPPWYEKQVIQFLQYYLGKEKKEKNDRQKVLTNVS